MFCLLFCYRWLPLKVSDKSIANQSIHALCGVAIGCLSKEIAWVSAVLLGILECDVWVGFSDISIQIHLL